MNKKQIIPVCISMLIALTGCNSGQGSSTVAIPMGDEAPAITDSTSNQPTSGPADPELITKRVTDIYEAVATAYPEIRDIAPSNDLLDDAYCSTEWNTLVGMVNAKDAENMGKGGFFDTDYWIMGQDWGEISISDLNIKIKDNLHAEASFLLHNLGSKTKVRLEMIFERGEWYISNFIDETHQQNWKQAMLLHLEDKGKKETEEKANDGIIEYQIGE